MPYPTPDKPTPALLRRLDVGQVVSADHGRRWGDEEAFGLAYDLECVADIDLPDVGVTSPTTIKIPYRKSYAARALKITVEMWATAIAAESTVEIKHSEIGTSVWCGPSQFDGVALLGSEPLGYRLHGVNVAWFDLKSVTYGALFDVEILVTGGVGISHVNLCEVPLADIDPVSEPNIEPSVNGAWPNVGNQLTDGGASDPYGFPRLMDEMELARTEVRRHISWAAPQDVGLCAVVTDVAFSATSILWRQDGNWSASYAPTFYMRARRLFDTATPNTYELVVWYMTTDAFQDGTIRIVVNGANTDNVLTASNGVWLLKTVAVTVPTSTTAQQVAFSYQAKIAGGGQTLYLAAISLIENEPV